MPRPASRMERRRFEALLKLQTFFGLNTFGPHSTHAPGEMLTLTNWDLFSRYLKSRRGSTNLTGTGDKIANREILAGCMWDVGADDYAVYQQVDVAGTGSEFFFLKLASDGVPTQIGSLSIASTTPADMFVSGDRIFVIHPVSNKIIDHESGTWSGRDLGLPKPFIGSLTAISSGSLTGKYTYGVELVYQVGSVDRVVSSPCRQIVTSLILGTIEVTSQNVRVVMDSTIPAANSLWTHARLWRSKNQNIDYTNPANPVDAQGNPDELYSLLTMTKADFVAASYTFTDDSTTDANLPLSADFLEIDRIELEPLPAAYVGAYHRNRIWVSRAQGVNDTSQANLYYSNYAGTKYAEQYDPDQVVYAEPGDGQQTMALISFERDLIAIKESKTLRVSDGNPDNGAETLDHRIGIEHRRMASYIPGLGIAAVTNDQGDFKIFGYDMRWSNQFGGADVARMIRNQTSALTAAQVSFLYLNGKLWIGDGTGVFYVLNVEQSRGWSKYSYPLNSRAELVMAFANGTRAVVLSRNTVAVEIDKDYDTTTDFDTSDDTTNPISCELTTHRFQNEGGRDVLEAKYLSVLAELDDVMSGVPYGNGLPWPDGAAAASTTLILDPSNYAGKTALKQREYRLFLQRRMVCNYLHYVLTTTAPATVHEIALAAIVDEVGMGIAFDPYSQLQFSSVFPTWNGNILLHLAFDQDSDTAFDLSGRSRDHAYSEGSGGSRTFDSAQVPGGGQTLVAGTGSGYTDADWDALDYIGDNDGLNSATLTYEWVVEFTSLAAEVVIQEGGDGSSYWRMKVNTDGSLEFQILTTGGSALSYKWTSAAGTVVTGTQYTIQFVLSNSGQNGQFYAAARTADFAELVTTRAAL